MWKLNEDDRKKRIDSEKEKYESIKFVAKKIKMKRKNEAF